MVFDFDNRTETPNEIRDIFIKMSSEFEQCAMIFKPSSSSFIYQGSKELIGAKGWHLYIPVEDMSLITKTTEILWKLQWKYSGYFTTTSVDTYPKMLERGLYDGCVTSKLKSYFIKNINN